MHKTKVGIGYRLVPKTQDEMIGVVGTLRVELADSCDVSMVDIDKESTSLDKCDLFVLIMGEESTALGIKAGIAHAQSGVPLLLLYPSRAQWGSVMKAVLTPPWPIIERRIADAKAAVRAVQDVIGELGLNELPAKRGGGEIWNAGSGLGE